MSLLIKALQKAEEEKATDGSMGASMGELSLEPKPFDRKHDTTPALSIDPISRPQQAAASVFSAKQPLAISAVNKQKLLLIGIAGLLLLLLIGMQVYSYIDSSNQSQLVVPRAPLVQPSPQPSPQTPTTPSRVITEVDGAASQPVIAETNAPAQNEPGVAEAESIAPVSRSSEPVAQKPGPAQSKPQVRQSEDVIMGAPVAVPDESALKITRNPVELGINPDLSAAYQAFNAGDDAKAQYHYRKVLQSDVRNTDALLGMAAIASRQGRTPDAAGWYAKVLEVDPRNSIALAALASGYAQVDPVGAESRLKNLLVQKPEAAPLHAALGNLYAERNDWPQAQQAYFQAHHFAPANPDYAFNLAISLDHLGKPALALQYYKQALALMSQSGSGNIDRAQLASRIQQLQ
jgi:Tfp pilus assembly protein PilF